MVYRGAKAIFAFLLLGALLSGCSTVKIDPQLKQRISTIEELAIVQPLVDVTRYEYPGDVGSKADSSQVIENTINQLRASLENIFNLIPMGMIPEDQARGIAGDVSYIRNILVKTKNTLSIKADHFLWDYLRKKDQDYFLVVHMEGFSRSRENFLALMSDRVRVGSLKGTLQSGFSLTALLFDGRSGEVLYFANVQSPTDQIGSLLDDLVSIKRRRQ